MNQPASLRPSPSSSPAASVFKVNDDAASPTGTAHTRVQAVDVVRGLVMVIMALDHIREFWSPMTMRAEDVVQASAALFFTRWVTHFCAPTFVFLSGVSIWLSARKHHSRAHTSGFLLTRGLWLVAVFKRVVQGIDLSRPKGVRDRALLLLGLAGAFRREELVSLDVAHLRFDEDGLVVDLQRSKTNQLGEPDEKAVFFAPDRRTCPVRAVKDWLQVLEENGRSSGPLFVSFYNGQRLTPKRLSPERVNLVVQEYLGADYTAHSLRASFVTITKLAGSDDAKIMNQTKHKTTAMIRRYTRLDNIRQHNAAQDLAL
ncbi:integrase family protein [Hymenobacter roseosalivarius DSM 11622]|uniref:Integrase family protein n=1 Tax=Hymenobacter roseosalivarius DSM 11622 TaxID=645990 RepID=A0A1W1UJU4_9BACT|nr:tyrosine-type recombinase/integrase [Hymenobacter roseosalivarius]SMB81366.1 integrase family protein [Hymenobacter roseosalivarius DSM 11622]